MDITLQMSYVEGRVWTRTRDELTLLFTRAQQAQNDKYKKILITFIGSS